MKLTKARLRYYIPRSLTRLIAGLLAGMLRLDSGAMYDWTLREQLNEWQEKASR